MQYRLLRAPPAAPARGRLLHFAFAPVDTQFGRLRMAVDYQARDPARLPAASKPARGRRRGRERRARAQASAAVTVLEATTAPPPLPQIIADYVGRAPGGALGARLASPLSASMHLPRPPGAPPDPAASPPAPAGARHYGRQQAVGADAGATVMVEHGDRRLGRGWVGSTAPPGGAVTPSALYARCAPR